ncbi:hypothetical protein Tco_0381683, partial [Tanacetum coccineum]
EYVFCAMTSGARWCQAWSVIIDGSEKISNDDSFEDIDYIEASLPDSELVSLEEVKDDILREKLFNINLLIAKIESLNDKPTLIIPSSESKVHIEVLSVLWGNRLPIPDGSLPLSSLLKGRGNYQGSTCDLLLLPLTTDVAAFLKAEVTDIAQKDKKQSKKDKTEHGNGMSMKNRSRRRKLTLLDGNDARNGVLVSPRWQSQDISLVDGTWHSNQGSGLDDQRRFGFKG